MMCEQRAARDAALEAAAQSARAAADATAAQLAARAEEAIQVCIYLLHGGVHVQFCGLR